MWVVWSEILLLSVRLLSRRSARCGGKNTTGSIGMERKLAAKPLRLLRNLGIAVPEEIEIDINLLVSFFDRHVGESKEDSFKALPDDIRDDCHGIFFLEKYH